MSLPIYEKGDALDLDLINSPQANTALLRFYRFFKLALILAEADQSSSLHSNCQRTAGCSFLATSSTYSSDFHLPSQTKSLSQLYISTPFSETNHHR
jgi:hypothetical protein